MDIKQRRPRRTNQELEKDILEATKLEIEKNGFMNLTIVGIAKRANLEPSVFYKRYKDLKALLELYIDKYDYWHTELLSSFQNVSSVDYEVYTEKVFTQMTDYLHNDKSMQELILWELTHDNSITRRSNKMREESTTYLVDTLDRYFKEKEISIDFRAFSAILLSSVYFLIIHKGKSTFCGIDFSTHKGRELLKDTMTKLVQKVFEEKQLQENTMAIASKMKSKGIDLITISECTGLSMEELNNLS